MSIFQKYLDNRSKNKLYNNEIKKYNKINEDFKTISNLHDYIENYTLLIDQFKIIENIEMDSSYFDFSEQQLIDRAIKQINVMYIDSMNNIFTNNDLNVAKEEVEKIKNNLASYKSDYFNSSIEKILKDMDNVLNDFINVFNNYQKKLELNDYNNYINNMERKEYDKKYIYSVDDIIDNNGHDEYEDPLYNEIVEFAIMSGRISASLIQRKYLLGYNRACRIIDLLEERGIIGPQNGSKPREVLIRLEEDE